MAVTVSSSPMPTSQNNQNTNPITGDTGTPTDGETTNPTDGETTSPTDEGSPPVIPTPTNLGQNHEVRVYYYSKDGTPRNVPDELFLAGIQWEYLDAGGMSRATIPLAVPFKQFARYVALGDSIHIWVGSTRVWVGEVSEPTHNFDTAEGTSLVCYGQMERLNSIRFTGRIIKRGGADLAYFANLLLNELAAKTGLVFDRDIQNTGIQLDRLEGPKSHREAWNTLMDTAPGAVVWGFEVSPGPNLLRAYLRLKVALVGYELPANAIVVSMSETEPLADVFNVQHLKGGAARFPNLVGEGAKAEGNANTSFEYPEPVDVFTGNIIKNYSVEGADVLGMFIIPFWSLSGGATETQLAHTGQTGIFLPAGASASQTYNPVSGQNRIIPGRTYTLTSYGRANSGGGSPALSVLLTWLNSSGAALSGSLTWTENVTGSAWEEYPLDRATGVAWKGVAPAGATGYSLQVTNTSASGGTIIDDIALLDVDGFFQPGWKLEARGLASIVDQQPAYALDSWHGRYSWRLNVTAVDVDNHSVRLMPLERFEINPGDILQFGFRAKSAPGATSFPQVRLLAVPYKSDGSHVDEGTRGKLWAAESSAVADWKLFSFTTADLPADTAVVELILDIGTGGHLLLDGFFGRHIAAGEEFIEGDTWAKVISTGTVTGLKQYTVPANLSVAASASITNYGPRETEISNDALREWNSRTEAFARASLEQTAVVRHSLPVSVDPAPNLLITPATGLQVRVVGLAESMGDDWPASVTYTEQAMRLACNLELGSPEPSLAIDTAAVRRF